MEEWKENLIICWIGQFFSIMGFAFALPFAPYYLQELGVTDPAQLRICRDHRPDNGLCYADLGLPSGSHGA